jgi:hypothetical protein
VRPVRCSRGTPTCRGTEHFRGTRQPPAGDHKAHTARDATLGKGMPSRDSVSWGRPVSKTGMEEVGVRRLVSSRAVSVRSPLGYRIMPRALQSAAVLSRRTVLSLVRERSRSQDADACGRRDRRHNPGARKWFLVIPRRRHRRAHPGTTTEFGETASAYLLPWVFAPLINFARVDPEGNATDGLGGLA